MGQVFSLVMGRLGERAAIQGDVAMLACTSATITARHPVPTQIDGDLLGHTPLQVESEAGELRLIVPGSAAPLGLAPH
jgi:diacylglycerol kinase family enzyme